MYCIIFLQNKFVFKRQFSVLLYCSTALLFKHTKQIESTIQRNLLLCQLDQIGSDIDGHFQTDNVINVIPGRFSQPGATALWAIAISGGSYGNTKEYKL